MALCTECGWEVETRNALGLAAQHHDRTGHIVNVEQCISVTYGIREARRAGVAVYEREEKA